MYVYIYIHVCIYIKRETEKDGLLQRPVLLIMSTQQNANVCVYIDMYMHMYISICIYPNAERQKDSLPQLPDHVTMSTQQMVIYVYVFICIFISMCKYIRIYMKGETDRRSANSNCQYV